MLPADYVYHALKGIKESFDNAMKNKIESYKDNRIINFYNTSEISEIFVSTEGMTGSKQLATLETPPTLKLDEGYEIEITEERFGGAIEIPEQTYKRDAADRTTKVDVYLQRARNLLIKDNINLFLTRAFRFLNNAFATTYHAAPDTAALCAAHTWNGGGTFNNSATAALSETAIDALELYGGAVTTPDGTPWPQDFDTIIVKKGSAAAKAAKQLFSFGINPVAVNDVNIYFGQKTVIETPYISYANRNYWFARASQMENSLAVGIGNYPSMNEPIKQNNEAIRTNVTGFWKQGIVNMPLDIYGSTGAA